MPKSGIIRRLSEPTINRIAAGEVIVNPSSVIKELVENAVDADATHIVIEILGGGFQSILVSDNGVGMSADDAVLALERHATSKIHDSEDLFRLQTMGFRGEALASIASISKLTLSTALQDEIGLTLDVEGGKINEISPSARSRGTTIEVRSLFYNVPARKKFQKTVAGSNADITRMATLLALAHPHIGFELIQQRKSIFIVNASQPKIKSSSLLLTRCSHLLGDDFKSHMHPIDFNENTFEIYGVISDPRQSRHNRTGQYLFVNARPVNCIALSMAIRDAYGMRLANDRHALFAVHFFIEPSLIDVNVHPQKKEVRFTEEFLVKQWVKKAINLGLQRSEVVAGREICLPQSPYLSELDSDQRLNDDSINPEFFSQKPQSQNVFFAEQMKTINASNEKILKTELGLTEWLRTIGIFEHYLLLETLFADSLGILWVDLLAAESRILYERLLQSKINENHTQSLLLPITFSCSKAEANHLLTCIDELNLLGMHLRAIGPTVFIVESIPPCLQPKDVQDSLHQLIEALTGNDSPCSSDKKLRECAQKICFAVCSQKKAFSLDEALMVFNALLKTDDPYHCPRGKPTIHPLKKNEIESYFT